MQCAASISLPLMSDNDVTGAASVIFSDTVRL